MPTTFTCPKCGRSGSLEKALPAGATLRCKGCQSAFSPARADDATSDHEASESQIEAFVGCLSPVLCRHTGMMKQRLWAR